MVATTNKALFCQAFFAVVTLLAISWSALAEIAQLPAQDDPANAQASCAGPALGFSAVLSEAAAADNIDDEMRREFLHHLERCRAVYAYQLEQLSEEFEDLPASAYCHSVRREFVEAESLFDIAAARAEQLPLASSKDQRSAAIFLDDANMALVRAVNGLFLLRHGICLEERIAPFDHPPFGGVTDQTYPHIE